MYEYDCNVYLYGLNKCFTVINMCNICSCSKATAAVASCVVYKFWKIAIGYTHIFLKIINIIADIF